MVSRFFEVTRYNAIVTRYGRVTLPKIFLSSGRGGVALPNTRGTRFRDFFSVSRYLTRSVSRYVVTRSVSRYVTRAVSRFYSIALLQYYFF